jgi:hypothetical protein
MSVPNVQWKTLDDGQRNCPKHVEFLDKDKFGEISAPDAFIKKKSGDGISHIRLFCFWTVPVVWCFETNAVVKNNEQSTTGVRIGACLKLRHTQLGPTCDTQIYCQFRAFFTFE